MRKFAFLAFVVIFIFLSAIPLHADDTELFTIQVTPDALIALDLSGSMEYNPGGDYNYQVSYIGDPEEYCTDEYTYPTSEPGHTNKCQSKHRVGSKKYVYKYAGADCAPPYYWQSSGSHTTDCSKLAIAKRAIFDILDDNNDGKLQTIDETSLNIRFGYMRFLQCRFEDSSVDYDSGCNTLLRGFDFNYKTLYDNYISGETNLWWTPLASQLKEGKKYLDDHKSGDTAKACRKKFIIMVTDGWDTLACGGDRESDEYTTRSFGYKRRRATLAAVKPAVDAGYRVFIVGFGADMPDTEKKTLEWSAFYGGTDNPSVANSGDTSAITPSSDPCQEYAGCTPNQAECTNAPNDPGYQTLSGYAFLASDATKLAQSLTSILRYILESSFSYTAPTIPSVRLIDKDVVYISSFIPNDTPFWKGNLKAYELNTDGTLPVDGNGNPLIANRLWDAFDRLEAVNPNSREIYTYRQGSVKEFTSGNISKEDLGVSTDDERNALINHVRGFDDYDVDQDAITGEWRRWKLGDFFHSNAVIIGEPNPYFEDNTEIGKDGQPEYQGAIAAYQGFYNDNKSRKKVLVVGANDGMLHVFDAATGDEIGAFIPPSVLTNLKSMKTSWDQYKATLIPQPHLYFVDATPRAAGVWFYSDAMDKTKTKDEWRTVLLCGLRKGGKTYFALNITNTENTQGFLWEFPTDAPTLAKMGQSWSDPAIGRVKIELSGELYERWVAFIGGGYDATAATGKAFFVVDLKDGQVIKEFSGLSGMTHSMPAPPKTVDVNGDGYVDKVYIADLGGQMWVFDVSFDAITKKSNSQWSGKILFQPHATVPEKHPVYSQAAVAFDKYSNVWVFYGTGDREVPRDTTCYERFYAVKDDGKGYDGNGTYPLKETHLKNVSSDNTFDPPSDPPYKGWYIKLSKNEKVLAKATVFYNLVYFTTYSPTEDPDPCTVGGTARLYIVEYLSGGGALAVDESSDLGGPASDRSKIIGSGIPSDAVISVNQKGKASVIVGTTSGQVISQQAFSPTTNKEFLYWREVIR